MQHILNVWCIKQSKRVTFYEIPLVLPYSFRLWFLLIYISRDYPFTKCGCSTGLSTTSTRTMIFFIPLQPFLVVDSNQKGTDVTARLCKSEMSNYALYFTPKGI
jgi:hypothetical protein